MQANLQNGPTFCLKHQDLSSQARTGMLTTVHGVIETPCFYFCATQATLKGLAVDALLAHHTPSLLANTYHLMLQPGASLIEKLGGIHHFMGWPRPVFTDSGGYQIFSLWHGSVSEEIKGQRRFKSRPPRVKISEEGALFVSHWNGQRHLLTPEKSVEVQCQLGSDFMCVLDECTPLHMSRQETGRSLALSHRWAKRSLTAFEQMRKPHQGLYGIVQGGIYPEFRKESALFIGELAFFGHAIGGSLGATKVQMQEVVAMALAYLPRHKPIHLLGIGGIHDIFEGVAKGIDTFDCVAPTRLGRHGGALIQSHYWDTANEPFHIRPHINLWRACFREDPRPIDEHCPCATCRQYSRAYLHHLLKTKEILGLTALTLHNVCFMNRLMSDIRQAIVQGTLRETKKRWVVEPLSSSTEGA